MGPATVKGFSYISNSYLVWWRTHLWVVKFFGSHTFNLGVVRLSKLSGHLLVNARNTYTSIFAQYSNILIVIDLG